MPFFPRVLEHLVRLGGTTGHRAGVPRRFPGEILKLVPQGEQGLAVAAEFAGQLGGRGALADTPQDQDQLRGRVVGLLERSAGVGVEDATARAAAVIEHGRVTALVKRHRIGPPTGRAVQPVGVEGVHQELVAGVGVQEIEDREVHRGASTRHPAERSKCNRRRNPPTVLFSTDAS